MWSAPGIIGVLIGHDLHVHVSGLRFWNESSHGSVFDLVFVYLAHDLVDRRIRIRISRVVPPRRVLRDLADPL